jgi:hypothetical protein
MLHVQRHRIDEAYLVPVGGKPAGVHAGSAADIEHSRRPRRQQPPQDIPGPQKLQPAPADVAQSVCQVHVADWREHLDTIVDSVLHHGGVACIDTTAILVEGDPAPLARALAERLRRLPDLPPEHETAQLRVQSRSVASALQDLLRSQAAGTTGWLGGESITSELDDGSVVLRPAVYEVDLADHPAMNVDLPFPCVWLAPWSREQGVAPLRNPLVVTTLGADDTLVDALLDEPSISNLYLGRHPTYWMRPRVPHDGYLGDFLMRSKGFIRD